MKNNATLKQRMRELNWDVKGIQAIRRKIDMKKYLMPTINMNSLKRVSTEV